ncbi:MAG: hypothetical protein V8S86_09895 [Eubacteriales bacterium]
MKLKLILLGSLSPLIGLLIFFLQLQVPFHGIKYLVILAIMSAVFLAYFFFCAFFFSSKQHKKNSLYFFVTPLYCSCHILWIDPKYVVLALIVSGVSAPFHYVLPDLIFPGDKFTNNAIFPLAICWIAFKIGERVGIYFKERI